MFKIFLFSSQINIFPQKTNGNAPFNFAILEIRNQGSSFLHHVWLFNLFCFSEEGKDTTGQIYQLRIWNRAHPCKESR